MVILWFVYLKSGSLRVYVDKNILQNFIDQEYKLLSGFFKFVILFGKGYNIKA